MKFSPNRFTRISAYTILFAGLAAALGACASGTQTPQTNPTPSLGQTTASPSIQLAQNEADEEYLGDKSPTKAEWINMLKLPPLTRSAGITPKLKGRSLNVPFNKDSAALTPNARQQLEPLRQALEDESLRNLKILIEGHTDSKGSASHNLWLSQQRALSVKQFLAQNADGGVRIEAKGLGEAQPLPGHSPEDPTNRRVYIRSMR